MSGELRALGLVHGLLLGLLLASPLIAPGLLPWGVEALFIIGAFQLRLADRRWDMRDGWRSWISHIRMAPLRLIPWGAAATVALIAGNSARAQAILIAASLCELLVYPVCTHVLARMSRRVVAVVLLLLILIGVSAVGEAIRYIIGFMTGMSACLFWLRGPDGEAHALGLALAGLVVAAIAPLLLPAALPVAFPAAIVCGTLALAHVSTLRRRPVPWRAGGGTQIKP
ncbi:hypothetical protein EBBID32_28410 [Sphingobium indicum BiD32]|uniref:Uncharacterized protein n=1 Tax=Sphingobium indicum BiD32 TaxID=1301087 RepID=N1MSU8_9SPHN|nr:hypothetical protein [Sphingobium indicum]CCW18488.1 hypothetical protein EBBID32_28410 [Sphingobium indicum BiD32]